MLRSLLIIPIILFAALHDSCSKSTAPATVVQPPVVPVIDTPQPSNSLKKYLALGDSYTIGQGVPSTDRYPVQAKSWLMANGITNIDNPQIIATTGWTTINLQNAISSQNPKGPYDVVSLLIGVNDQYQGMDAAGYETRFRQLLQKCIELANNKPAHVFVLSIPDYSVTPFASNGDREKISKEIDAFNAINKMVSISLAVQYLDITPSTRQAGSNPALICSDGLHPSGLEYKKWAEWLGMLMKPVLE